VHSPGAGEGAGRGDCDDEAKGWGSGDDAAVTGRPTKLNEALTAAICAEVEKGLPLEPVANSHGVSDSTLYEWLDKGLCGREPYSAFADAVARAKGLGELNLLRRILQGDEGGGFGQAKASAWVLERTRRAAYGQQRGLREEDAVRRVLEIVRGICKPADFARIISRLDALDREGGEGVPERDSSDESAIH
jgi:hypothetical protein